MHRKGCSSSKIACQTVRFIRRNPFLAANVPLIPDHLELGREDKITLRGRFVR